MLGSALAVVVEVAAAAAAAAVAWEEQVGQRLAVSDLALEVVVVVEAGRCLFAPAPASVVVVEVVVAQTLDSRYRCPWALVVVVVAVQPPGSLADHHQSRRHLS